MFLDDGNFAREFDEKVLPLIKTGKEGYFIGVDSAKIYYVAFENPRAKAKVLIVPGFTENTIKYRELIYNFYQAGYSVYIFDPRSQGKSERFLDDREMVWVKNWDDYVTDFKIFAQEVVPQDDLPAVIFSHSMGGSIVADVLTSEPGIAKAAVISSPIIALNIGNFPPSLTFLLKGIVHGMVLVGRGKTYSMGQEAFDSDSWTIEASSTSSSVRHERYKRDVVAAREQMGGASYNWLKEILIMNRKLHDEAILTKVTTPILMGQAGKDRLALASGQLRFCRLSKNSRLSVKPDSKHEIYNEVSAIRTPWINEILAFYTEHLPR